MRAVDCFRRGLVDARRIEVSTRLNAGWNTLGMADDLSLDRALERLDAWLSSTDEGRSILTSLRLPATDRELDDLRAAIEPYAVPPESKGFCAGTTARSPGLIRLIFSP